jgi:uncharacterized protein YprB with RNaseH-like and TPR domain
MTEKDVIQARLKRLRKAGGLQRRKKSAPAPAHDARITPAGLGALHDLPGMQEISGPGGSYLLRTVRYSLQHRQGRSALGDLLTLSPQALAFLSSHAQFHPQQAVFLDTETSGLAGGAGTLVFLTGVGTFEEGGYVVRQFFARNPAEERAYLPDLADFVAQRGGLITFNGRAFDWPLLRTRFMLAGITPPDEQPHVDLLHLARRLWRLRLGACHFGHLEQRILDFQRSGLDIPSWMIPNMWFEYARTRQNSHEMAAVLYHNLEDIVSMVPLAHTIAATLGREQPPHPQDWLALARVWLRAGYADLAEEGLRRALDVPQPPAMRAQALKELAMLLKRAGRQDEAAVWWQALADMNRPQELESLVMLAKYHEWHTRNLAQAKAFTQMAITRAQTTLSPAQRRETLPLLQHRLQRLQRKMG